jgi:hypothetical protein
MRPISAQVAETKNGIKPAGQWIIADMPPPTPQAAYIPIHLCEPSYRSRILGFTEPKE